MLDLTTRRGARVDAFASIRRFFYDLIFAPPAPHRDGEPNFWFLHAR